MKSFIKRFSDRHVLNEKDTIKIGSNYFLISPQQKPLAKKNPVSIGLFLGGGKNFKPSINLLQLIKPKTNNRVFLKKNKEWLFVCGKDISEFDGILGHSKHKLVLNRQDEVLGYGEMQKGKLLNKFDLGDFLRREK